PRRRSPLQRPADSARQDAHRPGQGRGHHVLGDHPGRAGSRVPARGHPRGGARMKTLAAAALAATLWSAAPVDAGGAARFPVIGYYPSWTGIDPDPAQFPKLTHVNYSFVSPTAAGGLGDVNAKVLS